MISWLFIFATFFTNLVAEDNPRAVIILDASGSMWGQIDGTPKITIAKDVLKDVVSKWNSQVELGLSVYGHRSKGDCDDIETIIPVGKVDKKAMIASVMGIQPKGKTPISRSMKKVANELKYTEEKATIILISDGKETCDIDPCQTAKALKKEGIDFITHVIGFNVDKKTDKELGCIAKATGGEYFSAKNATALNSAMSLISKKVERAKPTPKPKVKVKRLKINLKVTASEKEGSRWVDAYHRLYKVVDKEAEDSQFSSINSRKKEEGTKKLEVGKYLLQSEYNDFKVTTPFEIKAGEVTNLHIIMGETGKVEITASEKEGGRWIRAYHRIYKVVDGEAEDSQFKSINSYKKSSGIKQIPVGKYVVKSEYNKFNKTTPFEIKAGKVTKLHIVFGQFYIESKCSDMSESVSYEVYASSGQLLVEEKSVCSKRLKLTLDNGKYSVEAKIASGKREVEFILGSDKPNSLTIDLRNLNHEEEIKADSTSREVQQNIDKQSKDSTNEDKEFEEMGKNLDMYTK
jgi:Ca-activated chloride channel family protein